MSEEISSIYENTKEVPEYGFPIGEEAYIYNASGVREKLIDIAGYENRIPTDTYHIGLDKNLYSDKPITTPMDALRLIAKEIAGDSCERSGVLFLDNNYFPITAGLLNIGDENSGSLSFNEGLRIGILCNAKKAILFHCHPDIYNYSHQTFCPSTEDYVSTRYSIGLYKLQGIDVIDSVIIAETYNENRGLKESAIYSLFDDRLYPTPDVTEVSNEQTMMRRWNTNHSYDYDRNGKRVFHKEARLSREGLIYKDDNGEEKI